ncbi:MAG: type II toxin-antitoxin system Phd/YefM family antitoxin [Sporichthyaceae bacterium]
MTVQVNVAEAKTQLSQLLARAEAGEEVVIARAGKPVVRLAPVEKPRREFGFMPHVKIADEDLFAPMSDEELALWEGRGDEEW